VIGYDRSFQHRVSVDQRTGDLGDVPDGAVCVVDAGDSRETCASVAGQISKQQSLPIAVSKAEADAIGRRARMRSSR
jgi:hypothetical protein